MNITDRIKKDILNILSRHEGRELNAIVIEQIGKEILKVLEPYYFQLNTGIQFPIEFENNLGFWKLHENLNVDFYPRKKVQYIKCNITITK